MSLPADHAPLLLLAASLAVDATAVAAARGMAATTLSAARVLTVAAVFGAFHALMPSLGWLAGSAVGRPASGLQTGLAFGVLAVLGAKMVWDGSIGHPRVEGPGLTLASLVPVGFVTSVDAAAAGLALPALDAPLVWSALLIGMVTAVSSGLAVMVGRRARAALGGSAEVFGGVTLIGLGVSKLLT